MKRLFTYHLNPFQEARLILTLWYIAFVLFLVVVFNFGAFYAQEHAFVQPFQGEKTLVVPNPKTMTPDTLVFRNMPVNGVTKVVNLADVTKQFRLRLLLIDLVIIFFTAIAAYFLSGLTLRPIQRAMKAQEAFAADASHELRTPLSVIAMEIETLKRTEEHLPKPYRNTLESIQEEVKRMTNIVQGLLTIVRNDYGKSQTNHTRFSLSELVEKTGGQMEKLAKEKHVIYKQEIRKEVFMKGSEEHIKQLVIILLDNAIKYTPAGKSVELKLAQDKQTAILSVTDTGIGIQSEEKETIFQRFYRSQNKTVQENTEGVGLGLSIAKRIVESHQGQIEVDSVPNEFTIFKITLPIS